MTTDNTTNTDAEFGITRTVDEGGIETVTVRFGRTVLTKRLSAISWTDRKGIVRTRRGEDDLESIFAAALNGSGDASKNTTIRTEGMEPPAKGTIVTYGGEPPTLDQSFARAVAADHRARAAAAEPTDLARPFFRK